MAEKTRFPQIPSTIWWGMRAALNRTPNATFDDEYLSVQFDVQKAAARAYVAELTAVGILNDDKKATPLAHKWRLDPSYSEAVSELIAKTYPEGLRDVAPAEEANRQKTISWFQQQGLGTGAAGNKAATYFLIGSPRPNESPNRPAMKSSAVEFPATTTSKTTMNVAKKMLRKPVAEKEDGKEDNAIPLNVNVQIHISADAGADQIEAIFSAMRRYLYAKQDN